MKLLGGTIDDTHLVEGLVFNQNASHAAGGPTKVEKAKIALIQFQLSSPKTNVCEEQSKKETDKEGLLKTDEYYYYYFLSFSFHNSILTNFRWMERLLWTIIKH